MKGLRTTIYRVSNMNAAKGWYSIAFDVEPYFDEPFYIGFNVGGYELGLQPEEEGESGHKLPSVISYWATDNVQGEFDKLIRIGAKSHEKPMNVGGELIVASVYDPWGNVVGLIYNPSFTLG
ncbi:MAG: putative enzyme related to lactoylglutathione lyase [Saprospiraceae bacterium]|jgi:predicted enzyme related to lactoylglutathione lyase